MSWNNGKGRGPWGASPSGGNNNRPPRPNRETEQAEIEELFRKGQESFRNVFGGGNNGGNGNGTMSWRPFYVGIAILLALWFSSGIYRVDADQQGVVLRFGEFHTTTGPGLNYHLPYPFETVYTPRVTTLNREEIGFRSRGPNTRVNMPEESLMLTGDKNLVSAQFEVQWRLKDAVDYLFNLRNPAAMVKPVAETSLREVMGNTPLSLALSDKRQAIAQDTQELMQKILDEYETGIEIYEVNLLAVDAPEPVVDAFIDVLAAQQEKETLRNQAMKYRDGIIPVAQGQAEKMIKDAQGYKEAVISRASGEASRFTSIYNEYVQAKDVTRKRMYLETMEEVMSGMNKMIIDNSAGSGVVPYLPLQELRNKIGTGGN